MSFLAAGWLLLLVPWLALAAWLWRREAHQVNVSGRFLWPDSATSPSQDLRRKSPPLWIITALLALLAILIGLADPVLFAGKIQVDVIVDPHVSMSARAGGKSILETLTSRLEHDLELIDTEIEPSYLIPFIDSPITRSEDLRSVRFTAASTAARMEELCAASERAGRPVVVVSAQKLDLPASAIRYAPAALPANASIERIGASVEPDPQLMLTISHSPGQSPFDVTIRTPIGQSTRRVNPDPTHTLTTVIIDLESSDIEWIQATLELEDSLAIDNCAYLARIGGWPRVEIVGAIPAAAERFAAVYTRQRPGGRGSASILFTSESSEHTAVRFASSFLDIQPQQVTLNWPRLRSTDAVSSTITRVATSVPDGFEATLQASGRAIVAVRWTAPRQVWIGFDVGELSQTPQWVRWMNELLNYLNDIGPPGWESESTDRIDSNWTPLQIEGSIQSSPGVYHQRSGAVIAANLPITKWAIGGSESVGKLGERLGPFKLSQSTSLASKCIGLALFLSVAAGGLMSARRSS